LLLLLAWLVLFWWCLQLPGVVLAGGISIGDGCPGKILACKVMVLAAVLGEAPRAVLKRIFSHLPLGFLPITKAGF